MGELDGPGACRRDGSRFVLDREHMIAAARYASPTWRLAGELIARVLSGELVLPFPILYRCQAAGHTNVVAPVSRGRTRFVPICDVCQQPVVYRDERDKARRYHPGACARRARAFTRIRPMRYVEVAGRA